MRRSERGFSLVELLVVVGIIGIMVAVAIPNVMGYLRIYRVRMGAEEVRTEILAGRLRAVTLNVDYGVLFVVRSDREYQYVIEDTYPATPTRTAAATLLANPAQVGPLRRLPQGVTFAANCNVNGTAVASNSTALRFDRLGLWCNPGSNANCPTVNAGSTFMNNGTTGSTICLRDARSTIQRLVFVSTGGRVTVTQ